MIFQIIKKNVKKNIILILSLIFLGKLLHSVYSNFFVFPEQTLLELQQKTNNFIVFRYDSIFEWNQKIQATPLYTVKKLEDSQVIEEYAYELNKQIMDSIPLEKFNPFYYHIKTQSNEFVMLNVYFYKKLLSFPVIFSIFYDSLLWTFFLFATFLTFLTILYLLAAFLYRLKKITGEILEKKIYKNVYN